MQGEEVAVNRDDREIARQRIDVLQRWLRFNDLALINITTGQAPDLLPYRLEDLMLEMAKVGDRCDRGDES